MQCISAKNENNPPSFEAGVENGDCGSYYCECHDGVSRTLDNKILYRLDLATIMAGTKYRNEFEERIMIRNDIRRAAGEIILFVDEVHMLIGAGSGRKHGCR